MGPPTSSDDEAVSKHFCDSASPRSDESVLVTVRLRSFRHYLMIGCKLRDTPCMNQGLSADWQVVLRVPESS
jgi:hypothetical protein